MFTGLLVLLCCVVPLCDTLDVATVSSERNAAVMASLPSQTMSATQIARLGSVGLHEVLNLFSGVSVKDYGGIGGLKTVSVRNMGASHTSVIYDGISISDAQNGQVDISRFSPDGMAAVSMSIAMEDDIFCSARHMTSAGVLRLESAAPSFDGGQTAVRARMGFGSFGTFMPSISIGQRLARRYVLKASMNGTFSNGNYPFELTNGRVTTIERRSGSDVRSYGAEVDFHADWDSAGRLKAKVNYHDCERGLPGSVILYTRNACERLWDRAALANVMYDRSFGERWRFHADAGFSLSFNRHLDTDPVYPEPQDSRYLQNEYSLSVRGLYVISPRWKMSLAEDIFVNTLSSDIPECPFPVRLSNMTAFSARYESMRLRASAGVVCTYINEYLQTGEAPADRCRLSPMLGLSWNFHRNLRLRAGFKEGFRAPTFNDLYYARVGNVGLRPEIARQCNLGLTFGRTCRWGALDVTADAYHNFIKDKIVAVPTMFIWKMRNVGQVSMYGVDMTSSVLWKVCRTLSVRASGNWSLQYALDVTDSDSKTFHHQIPYTPRHCGSGYLSLESPWLDLSYRVTAVGVRYSSGQNLPSNAMQAYADHSLVVSRTFQVGRRGGHDIYIGVEGLNLSGENYEVIHGYPMPGRHFRLTLRYEY